MATDRQIAANRRNAQKSTGPASPAGKARSRYNALKHGFCAEHFEIDRDVPGPVSIQDLLDHWNSFYQPASPAEALLIRQIVLCQWRLERAPRLESGLLSHTLRESFSSFNRTDKQTGQKTNPLSYDSEQDLQDAQIKSTRLLGLAWRDMSREADPLPKLQRYETALANRMVKAMNMLFKLRGHDQPGELPNQPNLDVTHEESMVCEEASPPAAPPAPDPAPTEPAPVRPTPAPKPPAADSTPLPPLCLDVHSAPPPSKTPLPKAG
jgi:hypothetical protein